MSLLHGACLCDAVRYEIRGSIIRLNLCHCDMCQKSHGAAFAPYLRVNKSDFHFVTGQDLVTSYQSSEEIIRTFCQRCGSNLQWIRNNSDGLGVAAGTLDSEVNIQPAAQFYCIESKSWHQLRDDVPQYETFPE